MARWEYQSSAAIPKSGGELQLYRREMAKAPEYAIRIKGEPGDLMSSRAHASEDALGTLPLGVLKATTELRVLIGGLVWASRLQRRCGGVTRRRSVFRILK